MEWAAGSTAGVAPSDLKALLAPFPSVEMTCWLLSAQVGPRGTGGSNPAPFRKESATNLTGKIEPARARNRRFESSSLQRRVDCKRSRGASSELKHLG